MGVGRISSDGGLLLSAAGAVQDCCCVEEGATCLICTTNGFTTPLYFTVTFSDVIECEGSAWCGNNIPLLLTQVGSTDGDQCRWYREYSCDGRDFIIRLRTGQWAGFAGPVLSVTESDEFGSQELMFLAYDNSPEWWTECSDGSVNNFLDEDDCGTTINSFDVIFYGGSATIERGDQT